MLPDQPDDPGDDQGQELDDRDSRDTPVRPRDLFLRHELEVRDPREQALLTEPERDHDEREQGTETEERDDHPRDPIAWPKRPRGVHIETPNRGSTRSAAAAALTAFPISQTSVIGPTPPGTGVMASAFAATLVELDVAHEPNLAGLGILDGIDTHVDGDHAVADHVARHETRDAGRHDQDVGLPRERGEIRSCANGRSPPWRAAGVRATPRACRPNPTARRPRGSSPDRTTPARGPVDLTYASSR